MYAFGHQVVLLIDKGLGVMGYPMAANLRKGLDQDITLLVHDMNAAACESLCHDAQRNNNITIVKSGAEAARAAVSMREATFLAHI